MVPGDRPVSSIGESGVLERVFSRLPAVRSGEVWSGDDAAVVASSGDTTLFTTDALVEGVDFDLRWATGADVGWKAVAVNASDIAAMGGRPTYAVATLALSLDHSVDVVDQLVDGILLAVGELDIALVGGDVTEARDLGLTVAMLGDVDSQGPVLRSGARPRDGIFVTGTLGA
ncbi:MAG: thiamine-phosphate kinase, partial [Actinomycetota bacterium]|nr:thiamine-phosphate kinase [Actinomycetota bacterium]